MPSWVWVKVTISFILYLLLYMNRSPDLLRFAAEMCYRRIADFIIAVMQLLLPQFRGHHVVTSHEPDSCFPAAGAQCRLVQDREEVFWRPAFGRRETNKREEGQESGGSGAKT